MDKMEFDKTRKAIGVNRLHDEDRKQMLGKFTDAGGRVLNEKSLNEKSRADDSRRRSRSGQGDTRLPSQLARDRMREENYQKDRVQRLLENEEKDAHSVVNRFIIRFQTWMAGIAFFSKDLVKPIFLSWINLDTKQALMEANMLAHELFTMNPEIGRKIIEDLDRKNPIHVELLEYAAKLYDRMELEELTRDYIANGEAPVSFERIRSPFFSLLRKLYIIKPYQDTYLISAELAIDSEEKHEQKSASLYAAKRKKIREDWRHLMNDIYPRMVLLAQRMELVKAEPGGRIFESIIQYTPVLVLGIRSAGDPLGGVAPTPQKNELVEEKKSEEEPPAEDEVLLHVEDIPESATRGLDYMESLVPADILSRIDPKGDMSRLSHRDKGLIAFLLFRVFEAKYSFLLTTTRVRYNATYRMGEKFDARRITNDLMNAIREVYDLMKIYIHESDEYNKGVADGTTTRNYIEHARRMQILDSRKGNSARELRQKILDLSVRIVSFFESLMADMEGTSKEIVENKDEAVKFDNQQEFSSQLNGLTIEQCIHDAHSYLKAVEYRLTKGDLYGGVLEMSMEDFLHAFPFASLPGDRENGNPA